MHDPSAQRVLPCPLRQRPHPHHRGRLTPDTIPYWELRTHSELATGVEQPFLTAYREGSFQYLMIVADKVAR
ncbi:hypothetical protein [Nocardia sp. MW-W600-9]